MEKSLLSLVFVLLFSTKLFATPMVENLSLNDDYIYEDGHDQITAGGPEGVVFKPDSDFFVESVELPIFFSERDVGYREFALSVRILELSDYNPNNSSSIETVWHAERIVYTDSRSDVPVGTPTNKSLINFGALNSSILQAEKYYLLMMDIEFNDIGHYYWQYSNQNPFPVWNTVSWDDLTWVLSNSPTFGFRVNGAPVPVPEPSTFLLLTCGIAGVISRKQYKDE